jgi:hypothetical protein
MRNVNYNDYKLRGTGPDIKNVFRLGYKKAISQMSKKATPKVEPRKSRVKF